MSACKVDVPLRNNNFIKYLFLEDLNPYRTQHGLLVWDASDPDAPVPDPYERFEDFRGMSPQMLQSFR